MADYICAPPVERLIPVSRGCDRSFSIQRLNSGGSAVNFDSGSTVYMWIDIDRSNPTKVDASISNAIASFVLDYSVCDLVKTGTRFRIVLDLGSQEIPLVVGKFERHDG
jgi:hypothetical protein